MTAALKFLAEERALVHRLIEHYRTRTNYRVQLVDGLILFAVVSVAIQVHFAAWFSPKLCCWLIVNPFSHHFSNIVASLRLSGRHISFQRFPFWYVVPCRFSLLRGHIQSSPGQSPQRKYAKNRQRYTFWWCTKWHFEVCGHNISWVSRNDALQRLRY